ncbi:MAG: hypothetical protein GTN75_00760 [Gemmatimonadetes bacterium]|nr:hypothetical protein [Gemmatimonadota bacterium]
MRPIRIALLLSPLIAIRLLVVPAGEWRVPHLPAGQKGHPSRHSTVTNDPHVQTQVDSQRVLEAVRSHQSRFERSRRRRLQRGAGSPGRRCDEIIGRYCLRHGDDEVEPQPEPPEVTEARDELVAQLDGAARSLPGDEWIAGQRVRYLVEAGRHREASQAARACRAVAAWWCTALHGYALHSAGEFESADSIFAIALSSMPEEERCRWTDITDLLDGRVRRRYARVACGERTDIEARFWWLADPLQMVPANDRRTEHFARRTLDRMQHRARSAFGNPWGSDLRELLVRYGWPGRFERVSYPTGTGGSRDEIVSHQARGSLRFAPAFDFLREVSSVRQSDWQLDHEKPRSVYAPAYVSSFQELGHQLAVFPRRDSAIVVAAYQLVAEEPIDSGSYEAALIISRDPASAPAVAGSRGTTRGVLAVAVEAVPTLLSLEMLSRADRRAARSRYGLRLEKVPVGLLALSDLLLLERADRLPDSLAAAVPLARPLERVRPGERLGVYWEVFGLGPGAEELSVSLTLAGESASWLRKTVEWLGLASQNQPLTLDWQEAVPSPTAVLARSLAIDLPADLQPAEYVLMLQVTPFGRETLTSSRSIDVVR